MPFLRLFLFLAVMFVPAMASASSDSQLWSTTGVNANLSERWRVSGDVVTRFSGDRDGLYEIEITGLVGYRINKKVTLWGGYVHDPQYSGGSHTVTEHRAREQATFDNLAKLGPGKLSGRMRLEQRWRPGADGTGWRLRPYLKASFPLKGKTALNFSSEPFFNLNTTAFQGRTGLDRVRNLISVSTLLSRRLNGEVGYMNQHGFVRDGEDTSDNIAYFALTVSI
jgi:hypothetical protein